MPDTTHLSIRIDSDVMRQLLHAANQRSSREKRHVDITRILEDLVRAHLPRVPLGVDPYQDLQDARDQAVEQGKLERHVWKMQ